MAYKYLYDFSLDGEHITVSGKTRAEAFEAYKEKTGVPCWFAKKHALVTCLGRMDNDRKT